jgi:hypothetical protein
MAIKITVDTTDATSQEIEDFNRRFIALDEIKRECRKYNILFNEINSDYKQEGVSMEEIKVERKCSLLKEKSPSFIQVAAAFLFSFMVATITLQSLWNWFIAPLGINELSSLHSAGLLLFTIAIKIVLFQKDNLSSTFTKEELLGATAGFITKCLLLFMLGLTIKSFM